MNVGVAKITLRLSGSFSLKDKRRVINSVRDRVRSKFNVAVAEVDQNDVWQVAVIGDHLRLQQRPTRRPDAGQRS